MSRFLQRLGIRFRLFGSFFSFLAKNKMWWLIPLLACLILLFVALLIGQSTPLGPFIYAIF